MQTLEGLNLLTAEEVAKFLRVKPRTVYLLVQKGQLAAMKINAKCFRFRREEVERYVRKKSSE